MKRLVLFFMTVSLTTFAQDSENDKYYSLGKKTKQRNLTYDQTKDIQFVKQYKNNTGTIDTEYTYKTCIGKQYMS